MTFHRRQYMFTARSDCLHLSLTRIRLRTQTCTRSCCRCCGAPGWASPARCRRASAASSSCPPMAPRCAGASGTILPVDCLCCSPLGWTNTHKIFVKLSRAAQRCAATCAAALYYGILLMCSGLLCSVWQDENQMCGAGRGTSSYGCTTWTKSCATTPR